MKWLLISALQAFAVVMASSEALSDLSCLAQRKPSKEPSCDSPSDPSLGGEGYEYELYTSSTDTYLLSFLLPIIHPVNLFDGPASVSHAEKCPTNNTLPTLKQMRYYAYYVGAVYCPYNLEDLTCLNYCEKFRNDVAAVAVVECPVHNTMALITVSHSRKEIVIAFRGSQDAWNYVLDAIFFQKDIDGCKFHLGFYIATMSLYDKVVAKVACQWRSHPNYKIVLVGHSLGAAMARLTLFFFLKLKQFPKAKYEIYAMGEPRSGNKAYADYFNSQSIVSVRIVARADIVPHAPPTSILGTKLLFDFYVHAGAEFWINGRKNQRFCRQDVYEDPACSCSLGPAYTLLDHQIYFDVDVTICGLTNPASLAGLPLGLPDAAKILPPLPKPVSNLIGVVATLGFKLIVPFLG